MKSKKYFWYFPIAIFNKQLKKIKRYLLDKKINYLIDNKGNLNGKLYNNSDGNLISINTFIDKAEYIKLEIIEQKLTIYLYIEYKNDTTEYKKIHKDIVELVNAK